MRPILLDTQLMVLLVVGATSLDIIPKHKNLIAFDIRDFQLLIKLLGPEPRLILLPNTVSEAANLLRQHRDPERGRIMDVFKAIVHNHQERYIPSKAATSRLEYKWLGVADAAILECCTDGYKILTADADLHVTASRLGLLSINFNHERDKWDLP